MKGRTSLPLNARPSFVDDFDHHSDVDVGQMIVTESTWDAPLGTFVSPIGSCSVCVCAVCFCELGCVLWI